MNENPQQEIKLNIGLMPKQKELLQAILSFKYPVIGYGGAAGGGKSAAIRYSAILIGMTYPNVNILIFRRKWKDLLNNHINPFLREFPQYKNTFNKTEGILRFPNGSILQFGYAEHDDDILDFIGLEIDLCFVDEATHATPKQLQFLRTRVRSKVFPRGVTVYTTNPGGVGHTYIKRLFIDKMYVDNERPSDYHYISARIQDNPIWVLPKLRADGIEVKEYYSWEEEKKIKYVLENSEYAIALQSMDEETKRAYLDGDWDVYGGLFFKQFDKKIEVVDPFVIDPNWKLIGSVDPGFSSPLSFNLLAQDFNGKIYCIATYYEAQKNSNQHAQDIKEFFWGESSFVKKFYGGRKPSMIVAGHDAWAKKDRFAIIANDVTFADVFQEHGLYLTKAVTDRHNGWWAMKSLMPERFEIFKDFNNPLVEQIMGVEADNRDPEDIAGKGNDPAVEDHCFIKGTRVLTLFGYKPIEKIKPNELVYTSKGFREVEATHRVGRQKVFKYDINGIEITCTPNHKFRVKRGFKEIHKINKCSELTPLNYIKYIADRKEYFRFNEITLLQRLKLIINKVKPLKTLPNTDIAIGGIDEADVYDLTVKDTHEYYVEGLLVHNCLDSVRYGIMSLYKPIQKFKDDTPEFLRRAQLKNKSSKYNTTILGV